MVVTCFYLYLGVLLSQCAQNVIQTSYKCLLSNDITFIFATQTENAWFSSKPEE